MLKKVKRLLSYFRMMVLIKDIKINSMNTQQLYVVKYEWVMNELFV